MAESIISVETKKSLNVTTTSEYVDSVSAMNVGNILFVYLILKTTAPSDSFFGVVLSFPNNGKSIRMDSVGVLQISGSADIGKTISATLQTNNGISIRLGASFANSPRLYFVAPYY